MLTDISESVDTFPRTVKGTASGFRQLWGDPRNFGLESNRGRFPLLPLAVDPKSTSSLLFVYYMAA
jgi:hypothetical protein